MGYVAVKGGTKAIEESIKELKYRRLSKRNPLEIEGILCGMRGLIDNVMSEGSIYSKELAALAIKQGEGNLEESVFLLRAYRSTLPRKYYTSAVNTSNMKVKRRISASFKDILGGQILGGAYDYTHRLLDFSLLKESQEDVEAWVSQYEKEDEDKVSTSLDKLPKVVDYLRKEGLIEKLELCDNVPYDVTKESLEFPSERSARLQVLTRGQTGAVNSLAYSALRSCGIEHPTVGELRVGEIPLYISLEEGEEEDYYIGEVEVTEVETFIPEGEKMKIGYGMCFGQNETKAISMSILDECLNVADPRYPTGNEEFVLLSVDSVESTGFISHLKLPHYVTFQSTLDAVRAVKEGEDNE